MEAITRYLAIWGAVVSTIAFLWNVRNSLTDRGALKLVGERAFLTRSFLAESDEIRHKAILRNMEPDEEKTDRFRVFAFNVGKRPIVVSDIKILYKGRELVASESPNEVWVRTVTVRSQFPLRIDAGDFAKFDYGWHVIDDSFQGVLLRSADGRKYHLSTSNIKSLKADHKKPMHVTFFGRENRDSIERSN